MRPATDGSIDALGEVDELEADLLGERPDEIGLRDVAVLDQDAAERLAARGLLGERRVELGLGDQALLAAATCRAVHRPTPILRTARRPLDPRAWLSAGLRRRL